jgi:transcriptional regulator GlxA family with amidase domain
MATPVFGAEATALSVEGLTRASDSVVRGQVRKMTSVLSDDGRRIFTRVDVDVTSTWRGPRVASVQVIVPGGVVGGIGQRVDGAPTFAGGEEVVVFLNRAEAGGYRVAGLAQGKFSVAGMNASPELSRTHMVAEQIGPGEHRAEGMTVADLERLVRSVP